MRTDADMWVGVFWWQVFAKPEGDQGPGQEEGKKSETLLPQRQDERSQEALAPE